MKIDLLIVGGGLAGGLLAYALSVRRPELRVRLVEREATVGGNHIWSFFGADIAAEHRWIVDPFVDHRWPGYDVRFPAHARAFDEPYHSLRSERFNERLRALLPPETFVTGEAVAVTTTRVQLSNQSVIEAGGVVDARGASAGGALDMGWQKFLGQELRTARPHGLTQPIIMDATVEQHDGFRFVYTLPLAPDRLFVEDTYYSDTQGIDVGVLRQRTADYAAAQHWRIAEVLSEEQGALPVTLGGDFEAYWADGGEAGKIGMRAARFHAATGYSLPQAVASAAAIAAMTDLSGQALATTLHGQARKAWTSGGYYRLLNKMAFRAATPHERFRIYERFYRLAPGLIARFYAGRSTPYDRFRILAGRPPVPIARAIKVLLET